MDKEKIRTVVEDDDWNITVRNFKDEADATSFILWYFERVMKTWNMDSFEDTWLSQWDIDSLNFYVDNYSLYLVKSCLFFNNPNKDDWTKEFRRNTERSRQEDRTTPWDWWEA